MQDLVVGRHRVALEQLVLEGGREAVKAEVAQHEQQAVHAGVPHALGHLGFDLPGQQEHGAARGDEDGQAKILQSGGAGAGAWSCRAGGGGPPEGVRTARPSAGRLQC